MTSKVAYWCVYLMVTAEVTTILTYQEFSKYFKTADRRLISTYMATRTLSEIGCCAKCALEEDCCSASFKETTKECHLSCVPLAGILEFAETNGNWVTFSKNDWFLVFRGIADIGSSIYESWMFGTNVTTTDEDCMRTDRTNCNQHYRSTLVDDWDNLGVKLVRFAIYKGVQGVAYITFDGVGSNYYNWFSTMRVVESTWLNLYNSSALFFAISGHAPRHFFICLSYNGCGEDMMVFAVIEYQGHSCNYDIHLTYPKLLYSLSNTWVRPETGTDLSNYRLCTKYRKKRKNFYFIGYPEDVPYKIFSHTALRIQGINSNLTYMFSNDISSGKYDYIIMRSQNSQTIEVDLVDQYAVQTLKM